MDKLQSGSTFTAMKNCQLVLAVLHLYVLHTCVSTYYYIQNIASAGELTDSSFISSINSTRQLRCGEECSRLSSCKLALVNDSKCSFYSFPRDVFVLPNVSILGLEQPTGGYIMWKAPHCAMNPTFKVLLNVYVVEGTAGTPDSQLMDGVLDDSQCYQTCLDVYGENCHIISYDEGNRTCLISSADFYSSWTLTSSSDAAFTCYRHQPDAWKMMYRRPKHTKLGYTHEVTGPWFNDTFYTVTALADSTAAAPDGTDWSVLKNGLVARWKYINIDKVKVSLYTDGVEQKYMIFNGKNSTIESWFSYENLLESSWTDLAPGLTHLALDWWWRLVANDVITLRAMYTVKLHNGCPGDLIWMLLIQDQISPACSFDYESESNIPKLLYSNSNTADYGDNLVEADYMVISISLQ